MKHILTLGLLLFSINLYASQFKLLKQKGEVTVIRGEREFSLTAKTNLKKEDILATKSSSFLKFEHFDSVVTLGPNSFFKYDQRSNAKASSLGELLYGHLRTQFLKNHKKTRIIKSKTAALGVRGTTILLHVTRDAKEYYERVEGKVHPAPTLSELKSLASKKDLFSQICCIEGKISVVTKAKEKLKRKVILKEGQVINYTGMGASFQRSTYSKRAIEGTANQLGLDF